MKYFLHVLVFVGFIIPAFCSAQVTPSVSTDSAGSLQAVVVTATRKGTALLALPYAVSSISRKELDAQQYRTIPEALMGATGVFVQKTNHGGGSPFVRGLTGNQTLLMIDGIRFNNATFRFGPNQYLNTVDAYTISKIEIARGTGSVQYGSDALGGVVQLFTKDPSFSTKKTLHASIIGKAASHDMEYTGRGEVQYQSEKMAIIAGYTNRTFGDLLGGDTTGRQTPSGYKEQSFDVKLKLKLKANATLVLSHQYMQQKDVPLYHRVKLENFAYYFFAPQKRQMSYARFELNSTNKLAEKLTVIASMQNSLEVRSYLKNGNANRFVEEDKVRTLGIVADVSSHIANNWTANTGVEYYHDKVKSNKQQVAVANNATVLQRGLYPDDATSGNFSVYSLHHIKLNRFEVEAGLRYNSFTIKIPDTVTTGLKLGDVSVKPASLVANVALLYHVNKHQSIYSSFSTGYRTPNIDDMGTLGLVDFRYELPAYGLKSEKTYNAEIGYRFINKKIESSLALFYMHLSDLITRVQVSGQQVGGYNVYTKQNSQQSYMRGGEVSFNYSITNHLVLKTAASYANGQNTSRSEPMRRIPPFNGRAMLAYNNAKWNVAIESLFAGKQNRLAQGDKDDNRIPAGGTPGWHVLNIYGGYTINKFTVRTGLQNMGNVDYRTHGSGINGVGRSAWLAVQVNL